MTDPIPARLAALKKMPLPELKAEEMRSHIEPVHWATEGKDHA